MLFEQNILEGPHQMVGDTGGDNGIGRHFHQQFHKTGELIPLEGKGRATKYNF